MTDTMDRLTRPVKITVCADGFVSVMEKPKDRRLGAAMVCYSAWTLKEAIDLIQQVCELRPCFHGGKTGMVLEPRAPEWPAEAGIGDIDQLGGLFEAADPLNRKKKSD
jgi:hypothetical protein